MDITFRRNSVERYVNKLNIIEGLRFFLQYFQRVPLQIEGSRSIPSRSHTFVKVDHEIISMAIFLLPLIQEGLLSFQTKVCTRSTGYPLSQAFPGKSVVR